MRKFDPERVLRNHIRKNPETGLEMQQFIDDEKPLPDDDFLSRKAEGVMLESFGTISEDKQEIETQQHLEAHDRYVQLSKKLIELNRQLREFDNELQILGVFQDELTEKSRRFDLEFITRSGFSDEVVLDQITHVENSLQAISEKISTRKESVTQLKSEIAKIRKVLVSIEGMLRPTTKSGEHKERHKMN